MLPVQRTAVVTRGGLIRVSHTHASTVGRLAVASEDQRARGNPERSGPPNSRYVVWNGFAVYEYSEDDPSHDCLVTIAGELVSVQKRRRELLTAGHVPTVVFACARGQTALETYDGGIFTKYWHEVTDADPDVTFRAAVQRVNEAIGRNGLRQRCEVVCREDILDKSASDTSLEEEVHVLMVFDMCRTDDGVRGKIL
jgi:hypothetical protein